MSAPQESPRDARSLGWRLLAASFVVTAVFHLLAAAIPSMRGGVPAWRHGLFVGVNALSVYGVLKRPRWFVALFAALVAQQLYSHGGDLWRTWASAHRVDVASLVVVIAMPCILALLIADARRHDA